MSEIEEICYNIKEQLNSLSLTAEDDELEMIIEYIKALDSVFNSLLINAREVQARFYYNATMLSDKSSWNYYYRFSGVIRGIVCLIDDYRDLLENYPAEWSDLNEFLEGVTLWMAGYLFDSTSRTDYGDCSIETLVRLKKRVTTALKKRDLGILKQDYISRV